MLVMSFKCRSNIHVGLDYISKRLRRMSFAHGQISSNNQTLHCRENYVNNEVKFSTDLSVSNYKENLSVILLISLRIVNIFLNFSHL